MKLGVRLEDGVEIRIVQAREKEKEIPFEDCLRGRLKKKKVSQWR